MTTVYDIMLHNMTHRIKENITHTSLRKDDEAMVFRHHDTDIVTAYPDGRVRLNSGGWQTNTTKKAINRYLPTGWILYQEKGKWWLQGPASHVAFAFRDGFVIPANTD